MRSLGSSPLTRGKHLVTAPEESWKRLIPAHAGKTPPAKRAGAASRAHPRSRGENADRQRETATAWGSSPLTRGKPDLSEVGGPLTRLIPAHAGKTMNGVSSISATTAHPRSRGENEIGGGLGAHQFGSSPLTRGKRGVRCRCGRSLGLIPAHAGKTRGGW